MIEQAIHSSKIRQQVRFDMRFESLALLPLGTTVKPIKIGRGKNTGRTSLKEYMAISDRAQQKHRRERAIVSAMETAGLVENKGRAKKKDRAPAAKNFSCPYCHRMYWGEHSYASRRTWLVHFRNDHYEDGSLLAYALIADECDD